MVPQIGAAGCEAKRMIFWVCHLLYRGVPTYVPTIRPCETDDLRARIHIRAAFQTSQFT